LSTITPIASNEKMAWLKDRAVFLWVSLIPAAASFAIAENGTPLFFFVAILLPLYPSKLASSSRVALLFISVTSFFLGDPFFVVSVPLALAIIKKYRLAYLSVIILYIFGVTFPYFQNIPNFLSLKIHVASSIIFLIPSVTFTILGIRSVKNYEAFYSIVFAIIVFLFLEQMTRGGWIGVSEFTNPYFRSFIALFPVMLAGILILPTKKPQESGNVTWIIVFVLGFLLSFIIPSKKISGIVFDESHGKWETVLSRYGPEDFGRGVNYTYSLLAGYSKRLTGVSSTYINENDQLPSSDSLFVLKMPVRSLSQQFNKRLSSWVGDGGRLLIVADHTDLYNSTQNLTPLLDRFGVALNSDAVYDRTGMPNVVDSYAADFILGRIHYNSDSFLWQTGTSFSSIPIGSLALLSYGASFSEPGDYSRQNRFGPFLPRTILRYGNHSAVLAFPFGAGAVALVLDSTPWSNFSIFKEAYVDLYRGIIQVLSFPMLLRFVGWGSLILLLIFPLCFISNKNIYLIVLGFVLGISMGATCRIAFVTVDTAIEGRDYSLRVVTGKLAKLEFLKQLVFPGERNYSRIISSIAKYGFLPATKNPNEEIPNLETSKNWLLIEPESEQLPSAENVYAHLHKGNNITVLFSPEAAKNNDVKLWLAGMGILIQKKTGLSVSEDHGNIPFIFKENGGKSLMRDIRSIAIGLPTSILVQDYSDMLVQSFSIRGAVFRNANARLNISFSSEQFSDDAVGEVWDGLYPSSLGRLREKQLAGILKGVKVPRKYPDELFSPFSEQIHFEGLYSYVVLQDGSAVIKGKFKKSSLEFKNDFYSPDKTREKYLSKLRKGAIDLIISKCPKNNKVTKCEKRLLGPNMIEWMVLWSSDDNGDIKELELIHERRFSGLESTWNVVFAD
jgi:hypothetical protein